MGTSSTKIMNFHVMLIYRRRFSPDSSPKRGRGGGGGRRSGGDGGRGGRGHGGRGGRRICGRIRGHIRGRFCGPMCGFPTISAVPTTKFVFSRLLFHEKNM